MTIRALFDFGTALMNPPTQPPARLSYGIRDVVTQTGICRTAVYNALKTDPSFPRPYAIGRRRFFVAEEIHEWVRVQAAHRL
jgi:predicted DNA-binding transcriptional regulator AlpA